MLHADVDSWRALGILKPAMNDINKQIRERIDSFVGELSELVRRAALETLSDAIGSSANGLGKLARGRRADAGFGLLGGGRGGKRSPDEIENTSKSIIDYVRQNPGEGVEQISKALGTPSRELTLPIRKLVATGQLSTQGQKRATKYFLGGSRSEGRSGRGSSPRAAAGRPAKRKGAKGKRGRRG
jgi:hypothetical protein